MQPTSGSYTGTYVKQVTITVRDPADSTRVIARQSSIFSPLTAS
jgi:hypothetical protein